MFVHLNKKIAIPNCPKVRCVSWSVEHDFIGCGGENGMLKVIKLDTAAGVNFRTESGKNISLNQSLDSHKSTVESICWNESFQKLTSSDSNGTIIVWMFYKGMWYEEMVNNRQKSLVTGMAWTEDGNKICIVYEDGAIITGSVDGSRLWGKEMKNLNLHQVEWSPDGKIILIGTKELDIHILDHTGNLIGKLFVNNKIMMMNSGRKSPEIVGIKWFKKKKTEKNSFPLVVAFTNGKIQWMLNETDDHPLVIDCEMEINCIEWNSTGEMLAMTGIFFPTTTGGGTSKNILKIYNNQGEMLSMIKVPGTQINGCSWDRTGLRLVLAVDGYIYFAGIKPKIMWKFLSNAIVFRREKTLVFWQLKPGNQRYERTLKSPDDCLMASFRQQYLSVITENRIDLFNGGGTLLDYNLLPKNFRPIHCCMNSSRVIVASSDSFYQWTFKSFYKINNNNNVETLYTELVYNQDSNELETDSIGSKIFLVSNNTDDSITAITASDKYLIIGQESGCIVQYFLPTNGNKIKIIQMENGCLGPNRMELNRNSSRLAVTDRNFKFHIYDFDESNEITGTDGKWISLGSADHGGKQQQDIWDFTWATDHNDLIVLQDRNKLLVINFQSSKSIQIQEPITSTGYICRFHKLVIETVQLDQFMAMEKFNTNNNIDINDYMENLDSFYVKKIKEEISENSITNAINYALSRPDLPILWNVLSQESLLLKNIETAYLSMIKSRDYKGLEFLKRLNKIKDDNLEQAEILAYNQRFENAEQLYIDSDRIDLALNLNKTIGNHQKVLDLLQKHRLPNHEKELEEAHRKLGEWHADHCRWREASEHFEMINNGAYDQLAECYLNMEHFDGLISLIPKVQSDQTLIRMGLFFQLSGFGRESVKSYVRAGQFETAIQSCIQLNEWKLATELANQYQTKNIDHLLERYVEHLESDGGRYIEIIEVYRKASRPNEAIAIILRLIDSVKRKNRNDAALLKKLYVLIGLIYEESNNEKNVGNRKRDALNQLLMSSGVADVPDDHRSLASTKTLEDPWRGAEAYHYFLLAQRYVYRGDYNLAMSAALHLQEYEEYLSIEQIYSIIALTAFANKCYQISSKAFIKLESLDESNHQRWNSLLCDLIMFPASDSTIDDERRRRYEELAVEIFLDNPPTTPNGNTEITQVNCKFCNESIPEYSVVCPKCQSRFVTCVASGKSIVDPKHNWTCPRCHHHAIQAEISSYNHCPLCHFNFQ